ncbi:MAG: ISKra4 family transposase [Pseudomonadota bacterium]
MMQPQTRSDDNPFARSQAAFEGLCTRLRGRDAFAMSHADVERLLASEGRDILRQLFQDHLDLRGAHEQAAPRLRVVGDDDIERPHHRDATRDLRTRFGDVVVPRIGYGQRGASSRFPMDAALNLPRDGFSLGLRHVVALTVATAAFEESIAQIEATTGTRVAKRQAETLARAATQNFDTFYAQRQAPSATETSSLLVMSTDGKGIVVRLEDLRPATRKAAAKKPKPKLKTRLSKGEKKYRKRMSTVAAVYTVAPHIRTADDLLSDLLHETPPEQRRRPRPEHKRVWASLAKEPELVIAEMFDEAERRDPQHRKLWVVVVDGNKDQLAIIKKEAARRSVSVTIVLDFVHVLQYLWAASTAFHDETAPDREDWVLERLQAILCGKAVDVAAGMRRSATLRSLNTKARVPVDDCADYLLEYKAYLKYDQYLQIGFPVASGVIEGACRHLVNDRMDLSGAHWSLAGAEAVLKLRALKSSGDFAEYWTFHEQSEFKRNHADNYSGAVPVPGLPPGRPRLRLVK